MEVPNVRGLVVGRALLYPADGDVAARHRPRGSYRAAREVRHDPASPTRLARRRRPIRSSLTPDDAGWSYTGLTSAFVGPGSRALYPTGDSEACVLPLVGDRRRRELDGEQFVLDGRVSVFDRVTDFAYVPRDAHA